jgi:hypothetical protein
MLAVAVSAGDIVGQRTARVANGMPQRCWSYRWRWRPEIARTLAGQRNVLQGDSLRFEVTEGAAQRFQRFQLGGIVTHVWYESAVETPSMWGGVRGQCWYEKSSSVSASVTVRWELFDNTRQRVVYRKTTIGKTNSAGWVSFDAAVDAALGDAYVKLAEHEELLDLVSG